MTLRDRLAGDALYTFAVRILNVVIAAGLGVLTARTLGPHGRGIYALPTVDAALVSAAFSGLTGATSYYMLRRDAGRAVVRASLLCACAFVVAGVAACAILTFAAHTAWAFLPAALSLPGTAVLMVATGYVVGRRRVRLTATMALGSTVATLLAIGIAFLTLGVGAQPAIYAWVAGGLALAAWLLVWMIRDSRRLEPGSVDLRGFIGYALRTGAVYFVSLLNYRADVYLVALLAGPAMLGIYTLAVTGAETLMLATQVTAIVSSPDIGSLEPRAAAALVARCVRHNVIVAGICSIGLAIVAPYVVSLLYGERFLPMIPALRVLLIGVFVLSLGSPMSTYFTIRLGKPEVALVLAGISAAICIALSWALIPHIGIVGAAWGSTAGYIVGQTAAIAYFARAAKINPSTLLIPRWDDLRAYAAIAHGYASRLRSAKGNQAA
jgi:O-antigen/teichoic acid export membrane protein